jgi:hypothetical protein
MKKNTPESFWSRVNIAGPDDCWLWTGTVSHSGYGSYPLWGSVWTAHKLAYRLTHGINPAGRILVLCHTCDIRTCCNPVHLYIGTQKQNAWDREQRKPDYRPPSWTWPGAKLTPAQVREIRARHAAGESYPALGPRLRHAPGERRTDLSTRGLPRRRVTPAGVG